MKVFLPARHGLGNVIELYFIDKSGRAVLSRVIDGLRKGIITEAVVIYEHFMNMSIPQLFSGFGIRGVATKDFKGIDVSNGNNEMDPEINGYTNAWHLQNLALGLETDTIPEMPTTKPLTVVPEKYILFSGFAGEYERFLHDQQILTSIRSVFGETPIVSVGQPINRNGNLVSPLHGDIVLEGSLTLPEVMWLGKNSLLVVAAVSYFRTFSTLFGKRVYEVVERPSQVLIDHTNREYGLELYGITKGMNFWYQWPLERGTFEQALRDVRGYVL